MRILVTGASGFLGSHIARHLAGVGHQIVATGRNAERLAMLRDTTCELHTADLSGDPLDPLIAGCEAAVHCAARAAPWGHRALFWADNVTATERLIAAARAAGSVRRFVFLSSPSIYYRARDQFDLTEAFDPPRRWPTAYAETKWTAETRVLAAPELGPVVLRPRAVFGPRDSAIVPRIVAVARTGLFPLPRAGKAWIDVTFVDNVVAAVRAAMDRGPEVAGRAFNITNGQPIQVRDLLRRLMSALGLHPRLVPVPLGLLSTLARLSEHAAALRGGAHEPRLTSYGVGLLGYSQTLSIEAARKVLGYEPAVSIDEGMERYGRWWRAQP